MRAAALLLTGIATATAALGQTSTITYDAVHGPFTADLAYPARLAPAGGGGVYVTDPPSNQVIKYDSTGGSTVYAIPKGPVGIAVHSDGRVALSLADGTVAVYDATLTTSVLVNPSPMTLEQPNGLAFDSSDMLYVVDSAANQVLVFEESAPDVWTLGGAFGEPGSRLGQFASPQAIAIDNDLGHIIVTDVDNFRVQVWGMDGVAQRKFGYRILYTDDSELAWFARGEGVAVDECGNIYLTDALMGTVRVFDDSGVELDHDNDPALVYGTGPSNLQIPIDIAIDQAADKLFVASSYAAAVKVYDVVCTLGGVAAASEEGPGLRGAKGRQVAEGREGVTQLRWKARPEFPDNPAEIVAAMESGVYCIELDLNLDKVIDLDDLEIALSAFGAGTVEDFISADGQVASHDALNPPHILDLPNRCSRCHDMDGAPGGMLTMSGQENLCLSCHAGGSVATGMPIDGDDLNSHPRGVAAVGGASEGPSPGSELADHLDEGDIRCGTCHEPHETFEGQPYLRDNPLNPGLCMDCHQTLGDEWAHAGHADEHADPWSHYDWALPSRASCRMCHSGNGYIDYTDGLPAAQQNGEFRVLDCRVCHGVHGKPQSEGLLRTYGEVTLPGGTIVTTAGTNATCYVCHNGRRTPGGTSLTPHYLLGAVMLEGINGAEFTGYALSDSDDHRLLAGCTGCHMAPSPVVGGPADPNPGAGKVGGHTWNMTVHEEGAADDGFENAENACGGCHEELDKYNRTAGGNYDGLNGVQGIQDEVSGLLGLVHDALEAAGAVPLDGNPYWDVSGVKVCNAASYNQGETCTANADCIDVDHPLGLCIVDAAWVRTVRNGVWNHEYVKSDQSLGVHNAGYAVSLLQIAYKELTGSVVPGAALRYTTVP